jgi:hypothetical protein
MKSVIRKKPYLIPVFIILGIGAVVLFGWIVMSLWNAVLVPAVGVNTVGFWQALGILVLSRILVGGFGGGGKRRHRGDRCRDVSDEEKQRFKEEVRKRWGKPDEQDSNTQAESQV